jgi:transposase
MVLGGSSRLEAARQAGMDRQTLRDWVHRCNETGIAGLLSRLASGSTAKPTEAQMAELRALVVVGPDPKKHQVVRWRCVDLRAEVTRRFSVTVPESTIGKWLRKLKLTRLQPRPYHNLAVLRHMALDVMQKEGSKGSLRGKFKRAGWNDTYLTRLLAVLKCDCPEMWFSRFS